MKKGDSFWLGCLLFGGYMEVGGGPLIRQGLRPATFPVGEGFLRRGLFYHR